MNTARPTQGSGLKGRLLEALAIQRGKREDSDDGRSTRYLLTLNTGDQHS